MGPMNLSVVGKPELIENSPTCRILLKVGLLPADRWPFTNVSGLLDLRRSLTQVLYVLEHRFWSKVDQPFAFVLAKAQAIWGLYATPTSPTAGGLMLTRLYETSP